MGCNDVCSKHGFTITREGFCAVCTPWITDHLYVLPSSGWPCVECGAPKHRHLDKVKYNG